jgi:type III secretory pathway component EscV
MEPVLFYSVIVGAITISIIICSLVRKKSNNDKSNEEPSNKSNEEKEDDTRYYYILQKSLTIYDKQLKAIKQYQKQLESRLESIRQQNEELEKVQLAIIEANQAREYSETKQKLALFEKCIASMNKTNNAEVLYAQYQSALDYIRWFRAEEKYHADNIYLIENNSQKLFDKLKIIYNEMICKAAGYHLSKYRTKFYSLSTYNAINTNTQKIFVVLDTLMEMIEMDSHNGDFIFEKIKEYKEQVKMIAI